MGASEAIERYLSSGEYDPLFRDFDDGEVRQRDAADVLRSVLRRVVEHRTAHAPLRVPAVPDAPARVRARVAPMVTGLFPDEGGVFLDALCARVVPLTPASFSAATRALPLRTAWDLANLLLDEVGAEPLSDDSPELDGMCAAGRAWLFPAMILAPPGFPDVVVHEVAHLLHLVPRAELGLQAGGPLLRVPAGRRETFAYACELWNGIRVGGEPALTRFAPDDARVDRAVLRRLLEAAVAEPDAAWAGIRRWAERG